MKKRLLPALLALTTGLAIPAMGWAAGPTNAEVGDADSFGKRVVWLGMVQTGGVTLAADCTPNPNNPLGPDDRCVVLNAPPASTSVVEVDLGRITLPKDSTDDLICHWVTPVINFTFKNNTVDPVIARFSSTATYRLESKVLEGVIGHIEVPIATDSEFGTLAAGAVQTRQIRSTRTCIGGLISKSQLIGAYGLTEKQATQFFKEPITIRAGVIVSAQYVERATILYGTRFTGDHK